MSIVNRVLTSMHERCVYRPCDIAKSVGIETGEAGKILQQLANGGLVEQIKSDEYRRKKMYKTKQRSMRF